MLVIFIVFQVSLEVTNWKNNVDTETTEIQIVNEFIPTVAINGLKELYYTTSFFFQIMILNNIIDTVGV